MKFITLTLAKKKSPVIVAVDNITYIHPKGESKKSQSKSSTYIHFAGDVYSYVTVSESIDEIKKLIATYD